MMKIRFCGRLAMLMCLVLGHAHAQSTVDPAMVAVSKRTTQQLYLMARDVPAFLDKRDKVLFLDVRTRAEAMFVGMAPMVDGLVPYMELQDFMADWDTQKQTYVLEPNPGFLQEVHRRMQAKGLAKTDPVIVMCRSGERSGRAANRLGLDGFTQVYSVVDGFEGDISPAGRRDLNGWKNAGLSWSYKLDRLRVYFSH